MNAALGTVNGAVTASPGPSSRGSARETETRDMLTAEFLRSIMEYDPVTGVFRNLVKRGTSGVGRIAGHKSGRGYLQIKINRRPYLVHRLAWFYVHGVWPDGPIDHINTNRSDNRLINLRIATVSLNGANMRPKIPGRLKGTYRDARWDRWVAVITVNRQAHHLGSFDTEEQAHAAYCVAAKAAFGEFARTE